MCYIMVENIFGIELREDDATTNNIFIETNKKQM